MKYSILLFFLLPSFFLQSQLLPNGGFEVDDVAPFGKPDFFRFRIDGIQGLETDTVRSGSFAAKFNNTSSTHQAGYYYSHYNSSGQVNDFLEVSPGEVYEFSFYYRTSIGFTGNGIGCQILFANDQNEWVGNIAIDPYVISPGVWTRIAIRGEIPSSVSKIATGIYYNGTGIAWVDDANLERVGTPLAPNMGFERDTSAPYNKPDFHRPRFHQYHQWENDVHKTYLGQGAAKFDNPTPDPEICYYYGSYNAVGNEPQSIAVSPNDQYRIRCYARASEDFDGEGLSLGVIFFDENDEFVSRTDAVKMQSNQWGRFDFDFQIPDGVSNMVYTIEYSGQGEAWFDQVDLQLINPLLNSGFETHNISPDNLPDFWRPRYSNVAAGLETDPALVYDGEISARFNSDSSLTSYYYAPYNDAGTEVKHIAVIPGQEFTLKAMTKTSSDLVGQGIRMSFLFWNDLSFHSRFNTAWTKHNNWTLESLTTTVPEGANNMTISIEYQGRGSAWFDNVELQDLENLWFLRDAPIDEFEELSYAGGDLVSVEDMIDRFQYHDSIMETKYNNNGTWGVGYACHPLIRISGNAALAYLNAYSIIPEPRYLTRAYEALDYLVADQEPDGAFMWYFDKVNCGQGSLSAGAVMYEGGIAGAALIRGFEMSGDSSYLEASNKFCQYLVGRPPTANANASGFAIWALSENYRMTGNNDFLETAIIYFESLQAFQLESGMWADSHNQFIHYHGITIRGIVNLWSAMPDDHPKSGVMRHIVHKGINHIIRSQRPGGYMIRHPYIPLETYSIFALDPLVIGWDKFDFALLKEEIDELTLGAYQISPETTQGHRFNSIGLLLHHYYYKNLCPPNYVGDNTLIGVQLHSESFMTTGQLNSEQTIQGIQTEVIYNAAQSVTLLPGFTIESPAFFEVLLEGCVISQD